MKASKNIYKTKNYEKFYQKLSSNGKNKQNNCDSKLNIPVVVELLQNLKEIKNNLDKKELKQNELTTKTKNIKNIPK